MLAQQSYRLPSATAAALCGEDGEVFHVEKTIKLPERDETHELRIGIESPNGERCERIGRQHSPLTQVAAFARRKSIGVERFGLWKIRVARLEELIGEYRHSGLGFVCWYILLAKIVQGESRIRRKASFSSFMPSRRLSYAKIVQGERIAKLKTKAFQFCYSEPPPSFYKGNFFHWPGEGYAENLYFCAN